MTVVEHPTYMGEIREFFRDGDISCMGDQDIELGTYLGVKLNAQRIYNVVSEGRMPPDAPWPDNRIETLYNWLRDGCPRGIAQRGPWPDPPQVTRLRKDISALDEDEVDLLRRAFTEMQSREIHDPDGYFLIAGIHWLPGPDYACRHHENAYNPWHRAYLLRLEDSMRRMPGCEDVTIPYWDITAATLPDWLDEPPFRTYSLPVTMESRTGRRYRAGEETTRRALQEIPLAVQSAGIPETIRTAINDSRWEHFNGWVDGDRTQTGIIRAHDAGHGSGGASGAERRLSLANQDVAAFSPIFWFFHANWDRLWWEWQKGFGARSVGEFKTHLSGTADWIEDRAINRLDPFGLGVDDTIDLRAMGIDYEKSTSAEEGEVDAFTHSMVEFGSADAAIAPLRVPSADVASVRVKGLNRLSIEGSFEVHLLDGDSIVGREPFFQSSDPASCSTCRKKGTVNFNFYVPVSRLENAELRVRVIAWTEDGDEAEISLQDVGGPTVNVRLLLGR